MSKKTIAATVVSAATLALVASFAIADTTSNTGTPAPTPVGLPAVKMMVNINASGHITLSGSIAGISTNSITVNSWGGVWTVNTSSAKLIRRFGASSGLSEFSVGDYVMVTGTATQSASWTVDATVVRDMSIQVKNASFSGTVSNVSGSSFSFATKERGSVKVTVNTDATIVVNGKSGSVSDIQNGMIGVVSGVWDKTQSTVLANKVNLRTPPAGGSATACLKTATDTRNTATSSARSTYNDAIKAANATYQSAVTAAQSLTDKTAKRDALTAARKALNDVRTQARKDLQTALQSANTQFGSDRKACAG